MNMEQTTMGDCQETLETLNELSTKLDYLFSIYKPALNGEHYLTGEQLCKFLNISKRTLQGYRDSGVMPFISVFGKLLYKESDILAILEENYVSRLV